MSPSIIQIAVLGVVQGAAELLPVSSSAHVVVAEKLMHLDPASPEMLFLMVMLHTGTMGAVIAYFWKAWKESFFSSREATARSASRIFIASAVTVVVVMILKHVIEGIVLKGRPGAAIEDLTANLYLMAADLVVAGTLIVVAGLSVHSVGPNESAPADPVPPGSAFAIGFVQGLSLPFRGMSRSGSTISTGMLLGVPRRAAEEFSFALAVVITPPIIAREFLRFYASRAAANGTVHVAAMAMPGVLGMVFSFIAGLAALKWLTGWLENGRWQHFGFYCYAAAAGVCVLAAMGY